mgnify:CR=1 FL=1
MPIHDWTSVPAGIFHEFHGNWLFTLKTALNEKLLPAGYYALSEQRAGGLEGDIVTLANVASDDNEASEALVPSEGTLAVALAPPQVRYSLHAESAHYAKKARMVTIRHASNDRVVAVLEVVSPGNKAGRYALDTFVNKVHELLEAGVHVLVLDLFLPTPRDPDGIHKAIWDRLEEVPFERPAAQPYTFASYVANPEWRAYVETGGLQGNLPNVPLFLTCSRYVMVPLEDSYSRAFAALAPRWRREVEAVEMPMNEGEQ